MREITVISGKGGAGKTTITGALTTLLENTIITDCDVDAADLYLLLQPNNKSEHSFPGGAKAIVDNRLCVNCRKCIDHCRFDAFYYNAEGNLSVNEYHCEGCGLCKNICPVNAIQMVQEFTNKWYIADTRNGTMIHARMKPGEENSGRLVSELRRKAKELAENESMNYIVNDGPPGIGCATIASVTGTDMVVMVIEATMSGFHDFKRAAELVGSFQTPMVAVINKANINPELTTAIEKDLLNMNIQVVARIPFHKSVTEANTEGLTFPEYAPESAINKELQKLAHYLENDENYNASATTIRTAGNIKTM